MPKKSDPSLLNESGNYISRVATAKKYNNERYEPLNVRVPKGAKHKIQDYVEKMAEQEPDNPKYKDLVRGRVSLNAFITTLIETEMGVSLKDLKDPD